MNRATTDEAGLRRAFRRHLADGWCGGLPGRRSVTLTVDRGRAVVICHTPRAGGAAEALALAERVTAMFRGRIVGPARIGAPSIEIDGRDRARFRAIVTLPFREDRRC